MARAWIALALLLSACQSADESAGGSAGTVAYAAMEVPEMAQDASGPAPAPAATAAAAPAGGRRPAPRVLVRTAAMRIDVRDYDAARRAALATARRLGALVSGEDEQRMAYEVSNTLTIRVDAARFDSLLDAMAGLGSVTSRSVAVEDVTEQAVDLDARLRARRAVEARYVEILARANSVEDVLAVEKQLAETRVEIEVADGQLRALRDRVALSTLRLTLAEQSPTGLADGPGFASRLGGAFGTGWDGLLGLLVGMVALWPLAFLVPLGVWLWRKVRRRRPARGDAAP